ncbi:cupin domain-containing protein [Rhodopirellula sp. JC740]|uniref:Cupin domain-containing protein n=1 Tax=Rhodopirellula halodulae TaxID=2894198 RepID=A0ABS8NJE9_9BACT|nr:cupin domain-containing protein [Rhodopirellula sp. JC740]MCC9643524.1 cupin domain-containing protein [Rhodopirellula sp. JC740]
MNLIELAQRLRQLRLDRGYTLEDVAQRSGQTKSWLSRVENFRITPSLSSLAELANALGVSTASLLEGLDDRPQIVCVRHDQRQRIQRDPDSMIEYYSLAHERTHRTMDPFLLNVPSGEIREPRTHEGEEFLIVLKGRVQFIYGDETFTLTKGDSLYFDSEVEHALRNPYANDAEVLCLFRLGRE